MVKFFRKKNAWVFEDPPNVAVITVKRIISSDDWIAYVSHDLDDGGWQFHGTEESLESDAAIVSLGNIVKLDPSITQLADLPIGWHAWRKTPKGAWQKAKS